MGKYTQYDLFTSSEENWSDRLADQQLGRGCIFLNDSNETKVII